MGSETPLADPSRPSDWPPYVEGQRYIRDNVGVVWLLIPQYDGGMASTATAEGIWSVGINVLKSQRGPLEEVVTRDQVNEEWRRKIYAVWPDHDEPVHYWYYNSSTYLAHRIINESAALDIVEKNGGKYIVFLATETEMSG